MVKHIRRVWHK